MYSTAEFVDESQGFDEDVTKEEMAPPTPEQAKDAKYWEKRPYSNE